MEDNSGVGASPNISSVLKPPRPRIPLKDLMSTAYDEDNTAVRKRRVSFANVNKIKEFSAGAESMVVCHTPAYEEPFSMSSDSSCPSGGEGWTPVKTNSTFNQNNEGAMTETEQKENMRQSLPTMRMSGIYVPSDIAAENFTEGMEFTSCIIHHSTNTCSTRFSMGMDLTSVVEQNLNYSAAEGLNLTKTTSQQCETDTSGSNLFLNQSLDNSSALELTEAINNPILSTTTFTNTNVHPSMNPLYSVNNTRYSVNGMDLTQAAMSRRSSVGRMSTRYSLSGMDLTEAIDNNCSALEFTEVIIEPRIASTRYSVNEMEFTEAVQKDVTTRSIDRTDDVGDRLDYSADSETSMDFTKPIHNIYQSTVDRSEMPGSCMEFTEVLGIGEGRKSLNSPSKFESCDHRETFGVLNSINDSKLNPKQGDKISLEKSMTALLKQETSSTDKPLEVLPHCQNSITTNIARLSFVSEKDKGIMKPKSGSFSCMELTTENYNDSTSSVLGDNNIKEVTMTDEKAEIRCNEFKQSNPDDCKTRAENNIDDTDTTENVFNGIENVSLEQKFNFTNEEIMKESLVEPIIENDVPNCMNDSMRNITISRGGCKRATSTLTTPQELFLDSDREDSLTRGRTEQTSVLEPIGLIEQMDLNQTTAGAADQSKLIESLSLKKEKGGKRSFEMALEPENDTEESPVKQICLPAAIHLVESDLLLNTTAPSFLMHSLNAPNITFPSLHLTEITSTSRVEKAIHNQSSVVLNSGTTRECNFVTDEKCSANGIHFSLKLDVSAKCEQEISLDVNRDSMETSQSQMNEIYEKSVNFQNESIALNPQNSCELKKSSSARDESHSGTHYVLESPASISTIGWESTEMQKDKEGSILKDSLEKSQTQTHKSYEEKEESVNVEDESIALDLPQNICGPEKSASFKDESHIESDDVLESLASRSTTDWDSTEEHKDNEGSILKDSMETSQTKSQEHFEEKEQLVSVQDKSLALNLLQNSDGLKMSSSFKDASHIETDDVLESPASRTTMCRKSTGKQKDKESCILKDTMETSQIQLHESYDEKEQCVNIQDESIVITLNLSESSELEKSSSSKDMSHIETDVLESPGSRSTGWKSTEKQKDKDSCILKDEFNFCRPTSVAGSHTSNRYTIGANLVDKFNYNSSENMLQNKEFIKQRAKSTLFTNPHQNIQNRVNVRGYLLDSRDSMDIIRKCKQIRHLEKEVFACDLIPKWIEMQFSLDSGSIINPSYKLICTDREKDLVGEYILHHIKFARTHITDLVLELESPNDTFSTHLVKSLSLICKYHNGRMKGNVLTIEVVNCRRHFWATVDVNLKYPKFLNPMDITISKQIIGELKLSEVRQIFSSIEKGPDQLYKFSEELSKLRF